MTTLIQNGDKRFISAIRQEGMNEIADAIEELLCRVRGESSGEGDLDYCRPSKKWTNRINNFMAFTIQPRNWEILVSIRDTESPSEEVQIKNARIRLGCKKYGKGYVTFKFRNKVQSEDAFQLIRASSLTKGHLSPVERTAKAIAKNAVEKHFKAENMDVCSEQGKAAFNATVEKLRKDPQLLQQAAEIVRLLEEAAA